MIGSNYFKKILLASFFFCLLQNVYPQLQNGKWVDLYFMDEDDSPTTESLAPNQKQSESQAPPVSDIPTPKPVKEEEVLRALKKIPQFTAEILRKLGRDFEAISPIGLYSTLAVLWNLANKDSPSEIELSKLVNVQPTVLKAINDYLSTLKVTSLNLFFGRFNSENGLSNKAFEVLSHSGTKVSKEVAVLSKYVSEKTNNLVTDVEITNIETDVFLNIFTLKFNWFKNFTRQELSERFNEKGAYFMELEEDLRFITNDNYDAVQLEFSSGTGDTSVALPDVYSYMIRKKKGSYTFEQLLNEVHTKMKDIHKSKLKFLMPSYVLGQRIKYNGRDFPQLLRGRSDDFTSTLGKIEGISLEQSTIVCVNEGGASVIASTEAAIYYAQFFNDGTPRITFNSPFYHVIVEANSGAPLFFGKITEANDEPC
ncbi:hypothetical protein HMI54_002950 [Coelomomyces lativittatus]|nr:hypothetical protein HMI56_004145 [Coelomomyces lativittatus]KAJ1508750.1 hypothetical protein HMI54_002950 [Coelomomyces lativittatus]KAJ1509126.1 hypothetical protein HMI55_000092 [Coelomomyces lativittatus]